METFTIGWLNKCRCGNKSHTVKTARGNETALWDDDSVKCNSCGRGGVIQVCEGQARVLWETDEEMVEGNPMSTITKEFTKEQLIQKLKHRISVASGFPDSEKAKMDLELARIALESLEAEPVAWLLSGGGAKNNVSFDSGNAYADPLREVTPLYTAPPAPVSVPAAMEMDDDFDSAFEHGKAVGWNAYRAAMLQGADGNSPVHSGCRPAQNCISPAQCGNSPAIPDGWVMVPVEPTIAILDEFDSIIDYGAEDSKDAWSRLLAAAWIKSLPAAPQREVK